MHCDWGTADDRPAVSTENIFSYSYAQNIIQQNAQSSGTSHLAELCSSSVLDLQSRSTCFTSWLHYWLSWIYRPPYSPSKCSDSKFRQAMTTSSQIHPYSAIKIIFPYHHTLYTLFTWRNTIKYPFNKQTTTSSLSTVKFSNDEDDQNILCRRQRSDRLCGLVVTVSGYRYRGPGFDSRRYQIFWVVVGLERGPLSLVRSIEELLEYKVAAPVQKTRD